MARHTAEYRSVGHSSTGASLRCLQQDRRHRLDGGKQILSTRTILPTSASARCVKRIIRTPLQVYKPIHPGEEAQCTQIERIDPKILKKRISGWRLRREALIESSVMSHHGRIANKLDQTGTRLVRKRRICYLVVISDQTGHSSGICFPGLERYEPLGHNAALKAGGRYLRKFIMIVARSPCPRYRG